MSFICSSCGSQRFSRATAALSRAWSILSAMITSITLRVQAVHVRQPMLYMCVSPCELHAAFCAESEWPHTATMRLSRVACAHTAVLGACAAPLRKCSCTSARSACRVWRRLTDQQIRCFHSPNNGPTGMLLDHSIVLLGCERCVPGAKTAADARLNDWSNQHRVCCSPGAEACWEVSAEACHEPAGTVQQWQYANALQVGAQACGYQAPQLPQVRLHSTATHASRRQDRHGCECHTSSHPERQS